MNKFPTRSRLSAASCLTLVTAALLSACADVPRSQAPQVDSNASTQALKRAPRKAGELIAVSLYEFRSSVGEISARGSTDMFKTALVQSGQFRVVERARVNEGVVREKQLNASGLSSGSSASTLMTPAKYIFEGAITEAHAGQTQRSAVMRIAGVDFGASTQQDVLGIDVRVIDAASGDVVSVVTVRKTIASDSASVAGIGNLINAVLARKGKSYLAVPEVQFQQQRKESLDVALRSVIEQAVVELAGRIQ